jgi:hypothetical protein
LAGVCSALARTVAPGTEAANISSGTACMMVRASWSSVAIDCGAAFDSCGITAGFDPEAAFCPEAFALGFSAGLDSGLRGELLITLSEG